MESAAADIFVILIKLQKHPNIIKSAAADPISALWDPRYNAKKTMNFLKTENYTEACSILVFR